MEIPGGGTAFAFSRVDWLGFAKVNLGDRCHYGIRGKPAALGLDWRRLAGGSYRELKPQIEPQAT